MLVALVLLPVVALSELGGISETKAVLLDLDPGLLSPLSGMTSFGLASLLAWGLGYFGQPHIPVTKLGCLWGEYIAWVIFKRD